MQKIGDDVCIDITLARETDAKDENGNPLPPQPFYRVYTWEPRIDAQERTPDDLMHWALESEHDTPEAALDRANELLKDAATKPARPKAK